MKDYGFVITLLTAVFTAILAITLYIFLKDRIKPRAKATKAGKNHIIDYNLYEMSEREWLISVLAAAPVIFATGYVFYRSAAISLLITPASLLYPRIKVKAIISKRKEELNLQFKEALYSLSSSLSAGKSIETAFKDALKELALEYPDPETYIIKEIELINKRIEMNETIEEALADFAGRAHIEDIQSFTDVFVICKRTGGNLVHVIKNTADIINEKIDIKQEIKVMLTEKRLEHKVLNLMPVIIILLVSTSAEEFMKPVFTEPLGRAVMTISILLFAAAYFISSKIMDIEV
ncbi:MAG: type II secretion system F family protein [Caulobacteraceae bacterium]